MPNFIAFFTLQTFVLLKFRFRRMTQVKRVKVMCLDLPGRQNFPETVPQPLQAGHFCCSYSTSIPQGLAAKICFDLSGHHSHQPRNHPRHHLAVNSDHGLSFCRGGDSDNGLSFLFSTDLQCFWILAVQILRGLSFSLNSLVLWGWGVAPARHRQHSLFAVHVLFPQVLGAFVHGLFPQKSRDIPPKSLVSLGFQGHTALFGPHPFTWKTPTPPEKYPDQKVWVWVPFSWLI